jgi:hypothetical protein
MRTDGVILGKLIKFGDHTHLEWTCPDCGNECAAEGGWGPYRRDREDPTETGQTAYKREDVQCVPFLATQLRRIARCVMNLRNDGGDVKENRCNARSTSFATTRGPSIEATMPDDCAPCRTTVGLSRFRPQL